MSFTWQSYLWGSLAALLVGLSKTGVPGVAIPSVLLMADAFPENAKQSVAAILPLLLVGDLFAVAYYRHHAQWDRLWRLFPYVVVGMIPGLLVLQRADAQQFKLVLGWLVLGLLALEIARQWLGWHQVPGKWWFAGVAGVLAGFGTTLGNAAGPIMSIYLVSRGMPKHEFMGTWAWFFFIVNTAKLPLMLATPWIGANLMTYSTLQFGAVLVPVVAAGCLVGRRVFRIIPQRLFDPLVLLLAGAAAVKMVVE